MNMKDKVTPGLIKKAAAGLDRSEYPESAALLDDLLYDWYELSFDMFGESYDDLSEEQLAELYDEFAYGFGDAADKLMYECDCPRDLPPELLELAVLLYEEAIVLEDGCEDDGASANNLGAHYYNGARGLPQDFAKAVELYKKAAAQGSGVARENLGYCYYYGRHVEKDYEQAFGWFAQGAFLGEPASLYKIGDMYRHGLYVKQNVKTAFLIYKRCLLLMDDEEKKYAAGPVYLRLGDMYLKGLGTPADPREALECYRLAQCHLEEMVENGEYMYRKSLQSAIDGQEAAREALVDRAMQKE